MKDIKPTGKWNWNFNHILTKLVFCRSFGELACQVSVESNEVSLHTLASVYNCIKIHLYWFLIPSFFFNKSLSMHSEHWAIATWVRAMLKLHVKLLIVSLFSDKFFFWFKYLLVSSLILHIFNMIFKFIVFFFELFILLIIPKTPYST